MSTGRSSLLFEPANTTDTPPLTATTGPRRDNNNSSSMSGLEQGARATTQSLGEETSVPEHADRAVR